MTGATAMRIEAESILALSPEIRYVATYLHGEHRSVQRADLADASSSESDRYEELIVNPTLLTLVTQRGNIDCGGARCVLVRYGNFNQLVVPVEGGHVSVAIEVQPGAMQVAQSVLVWCGRGE